MNTSKTKTVWSRIWRVLRILLAIIGILVASLFTPWNTGRLVSHSNPAKNYAEAVQRIDAVKANRSSEMVPDCITQFMTHGKKTDKVIVLVHGYTNCPKEFVGLGKQFYDLGYNVLIAPLPHHGFKDRMNLEQGQLSADELVMYTDQVVDIAQGLGNRVTVMGISCGGVVTAWAAQNRNDVDMAVIISPAFGYQAIPTNISAPAMNTVITLPDVFVWWDPNLKMAEGPDYTYPQYSKHALAQIMRLGFSVQVNAKQKAPLAKRVFVITNANDDSVNNELTARVTQNWLQHGAQLITYEFPAALNLPHDLIDSNQPHANTEVVNQKLIDLITR